MATKTLYLKDCEFSAWNNGGEDYASMSSDRKIKGQFNGAGLNLAQYKITAIGIYGDYRRNTSLTYPMGNTNRGATLYNGSSISSIGSAVSSQEDGDSKMSNSYAAFTNYYTTDTNIINSLINQINSGLVVTIDLYADNNGSSSSYRIYGQNIRLEVTYDYVYYNIQIDCKPNAETGLSCQATGAGTYTFGSQVKIEAINIPANHKFSSWAVYGKQWYFWWDNPHTLEIDNDITNDGAYKVVTISCEIELDTYSVYFSGMGATNGSVSSITASGGSFVLPSNGFYKEVTVNWNANASDAVLSYNTSSLYCGFAGWTRNPSGGDVHQPGETVNYTPLEGSSSLTMYAVWNPAVFPYPTPTRTGYRFTGWNTKADGSGTAYTSGSVSTLENLTLYAQWVKTYTVTASGENGTVTGNTGTFTDGDTTVLTATPNPGYKFVKWILNGGAAGTVTDNPMSILVNQNLSITAVFEKLPPKFRSITITRSTDLAMVTINTPVEAGAKYIISVEVT